jgi:CRISPR-associated protein Cas4
MTDPLPISELRQLQYCPRIPFYHLRLALTRRKTYRMAEGQLIELKTLRLERRRSIAWYRLEDGKRSYRVPLSHEALGISGICDLVISSPKANVPVEIKAAKDNNVVAHRDQLVAYALCLEAHYQKAAPLGILLYVSSRGDRTQRIVEITPSRRRRVLRNVATLRDIAASDALPAATAQRSRCRWCEYRHFCADVF